MSAIPQAIDRTRPRGLARMVELGVLVIASAAAISTAMPLIDAEEWRLSQRDRETYDLVYGGVLRLAYLGCFVPPLLEAGAAVSALRGYHGGWRAQAIHVCAILECLFALSFALTCKQDVWRDLMIASHVALLGVVMAVRPAVSLWLDMRRQRRSPGPPPTNDAS